MSTGGDKKVFEFDKIIFLAGEKEKWVIKDTKRLLKTVKSRAKIIVIPKADHKIDKDYLDEILEIIRANT